MTTSPPTGRYLQVDLLKAVGILAVVLIHSLPAPWDPLSTPFDAWIGNVTRFAVPAFLMASGFLYATKEAVPRQLSLRRLRRILVPYLLASLGAQAYRIATGGASITGSVIVDLLAGASFGPYYYVLQILLLVALTPLFARLCGAAPMAFHWLVAISIGMQFVFDQGWVWMIDVGFTWYLRNPLVWWCYFLLGWLLRLHYAAIVDFVASRRLALVGAFALLLAGLLGWIALRPDEAEHRGVIGLSTYAICGLLFVLGAGRSTRSAALIFLSDASYAIYLFHLFLVLPLTPLLRVPGEFSALGLVALWSAGVGGSLLFVSAMKRLLGARSRDWIGA